MQRSIVWREFQGSLQFGDGGIEVGALQIGDGQVSAKRSVIRAQLRRRLEVRNRPDCVALLQLSQPKIVVGFGILGTQLYCVAKSSDRTIANSSVLAGETQFDLQFGPLGPQCSSLA